MAVIVLAGAGWGAETEQLLRDHATEPVRFTESAGYVARMADARVALVLVNGADAGWRFWTTTPKVSPATRRIPVVLLTADADQRVAALRAGANLVLAPHELAEMLPTLLNELARVVDPAQRTELERQCSQPLPPEALEAVRKFNAGEFYKQHDLFEALWMHETGPIRELYRGVLQVGIAYFQITRGNRRGALKMLLRSIQWLALLPDVCQSINVAQLRVDAAQVRAELERVGEDGLDQFDLTLLKPVQLVE